MNEQKFKLSVFIATLSGTLAGIVPAISCTGGCDTCYRCAGAGGAMAILVAIGAARKKLRNSGREKQGT